MQKGFAAAILIFCMARAVPAFSQTGYGDMAPVLRFTSAYTSFPDSARAAGHLYDSVLYTVAEHYNDSSVMVIIPPEAVGRHKKINLFFWFHGWRNNIDTADRFYGLRRQFFESHRNAVLVLAETAKNAPDSYGGKLERPGMFKALVADVIAHLKAAGYFAKKAALGNVVLAGHSGAYRVIANILQNGQVPVQEVFLFDALYGELDKYMAWVQQDSSHHFVHWFTNKGGGTDEMSDTMMQRLTNLHIPYTLTEETAVTPAIIKTNRILFAHSLREHNVIINNPDDFKVLLENSWWLKE